MKILVFNAGSSSLKFGVFDTNVTEMHIDTYEANAASINFSTKGELVIDEPCGQADMSMLAIM